MNDASTESPSFDQAQEQRDTIKGYRATRRAALATFATTLGYDPQLVRSIHVVEGSIRIFLFATDEAGEKIPDGSNHGFMQREVNLLFTDADLDADEQLDRFFSGLPAS